MSSLGAKRLSTEVHRQRKENQAILQLFLIAGAFLLGYLPRTGNWCQLTFFQIQSYVFQVFNFFKIARTPMKQKMFIF